MKNLPVKIASVAVIASMALSFAACSKKGGTDSRTESHSGDKIAADSPWFDSKTIDVDVNVDSSRKVDYASTSLVGAVLYSRHQQARWPSRKQRMGPSWDTTCTGTVLFPAVFLRQ